MHPCVAKQYDKDNSRSIDIKEGSALGSALALDSVSAALSLVGQGTVIWLFPICTAFLCGAFLWIGGQRIYHVRRLNGISGILLILLGLFRVLPVFF